MATKKATKKAAPKKATKPAALPAKLQKVLDSMEEGEEEVEGGKIANILFLFTKGFTKKQIVDQGFNRSTVYRQVKELEKLQKAPVMEYYGYEVFEAKVQRMAKAKGITRDAAYKLMMKKLEDTE